MGQLSPKERQMGEEVSPDLGKFPIDELTVIG